MVSAIIVAAGKGIRMNNVLRKQYISFMGRPVLGHTLLLFNACQMIDKICLVIPGEDEDFCRKKIIRPLGLIKEVSIIHGGNERQDSVYNGILSLDEKTCSIVVIHDGVRPFVRNEHLEACITNAKKSGACILGVPAVDTVKKVNKTGYIDKTLARDNIWLAQTPQAFQYPLIKKAHEDAKKNGLSGTDDSYLVERLGKKVKIIKGDRNNIKITDKQDLILAEALLKNRQKFC